VPLVVARVVNRKSTMREPHVANTIKNQPDLAASAAKKNKLDLNAPTLVAGAGATVTMSVLGSFLGPLGTVTGAAVTSITTAVITAVYKHTATVAQEKAKQAAFDRLKDRYKNRVTPLNEREQTQMIAAGQEVLDAKRQRSVWSGAKLATVGLAVAGGMFGGVMLATTGAEAVAGKPVSAIVQGKPGHGTSLGGGEVGRSNPRVTSTPTTGPRSTTSSTSSPGATETSSVPSGPVTVPPEPILPNHPQTSTAPTPGGVEPSNG
jgi:hypothetical protein